MNNSLYRQIQFDLSFIPRIIQDSDNDILTQTISTDEIKTAISQMNPYSAPGSDGFGPKCFQQYWDIIQIDLCSSHMDSF